MKLFMVLVVLKLPGASAESNLLISDIARQNMRQISPWLSDTLLFCFVFLRIKKNNLSHVIGGKKFWSQTPFIFVLV